MPEIKTDYNYKNIFYPPGGILVWILILLELLTFGIALIVFILKGQDSPETYHLSASHLNPAFGAINTVFLLTSGFLMATSVYQFKRNNKKASKLYLKLTVLGGVLFLVLKSIEYSYKIEKGLLLGYDTFFNFYWLLTGFHVIHVIVGIIILIFVYRGIGKTTTSLEDIEAGAAFWHMCDLIWLLLFPVLYLIF